MLICVCLCVYHLGFTVAITSSCATSHLVSPWTPAGQPLWHPVMSLPFLFCHLCPNQPICSACRPSYCSLIAPFHSAVLVLHPEICLVDPHTANKSLPIKRKAGEKGSSQNHGCLVVCRCRAASEVREGGKQPRQLMV